MNKVCKAMRIDCLKMAESAGKHGMHFGGTLSMIEIVAALYIFKMQVKKGYFEKETRDRVIISKGHGVPAVYAALHQTKVITDEDIKSFKADNSLLHGHPYMNVNIGMEFSSGSLGQGLSQGVGTAIALKHRGNDISRVYVILGDGECDEGSVWEAAMAASKFQLSNLVAIVDCNKLQYDGTTVDVMPIRDVNKLWKSCGWNVVVIDGHNMEECIAAFQSNYDLPTVVIANTIKGKGISFMENDPSWHHRQLSRKQLEQAYKELNEL